MASRFELLVAGARRLLEVTARRWRRTARERAFLSGRWSPPWEVEEALAREFSRLNTPHWPVPAAVRRPGQIWVEGHLAQYGPNYLARTAVAARALQELHGLRTMVVFPGYAHEWVAAVHMYRSFGLQDFVFLKRERGRVRGALDILASLFLAGWQMIGLKSPDELLHLRVGGVPAGDLVYDDTMRRARVPTVSGQRWTVWLLTAAAWRYVWQYRSLLRYGPAYYLVSTHGAYVEYGLLMRTAIAAGAVVVETTDTLNTIHRSMMADKLPTYHQGIANMLEIARSELSVEDEILLVDQAREQLEQRFAGALNQVDVALAYQDKRVYAQDALRRELGITDDRPLAFVFAHVFIDSPHISSRQLHRDYYAWLVETLEYASQIQDCHWIVKPHPSAPLYGEAGDVEKLVLAQRERVACSHLHVAPKDMNPATVVASACCVLTVQGTVALEYACKGVPSLVTGAAFYCGQGFTIEPRSREAYRDEMARVAAGVGRLSSTQTRQALLTYALWNRLAGYSSELIDQGILSKVWGYEGGRDLAEAYRLLLERMRVRSLQELDVANFVARYASAAP